MANGPSIRAVADKQDLEKLVTGTRSSAPGSSGNPAPTSLVFYVLDTDVDSSSDVDKVAAIVLGAAGAPAKFGLCSVDVSKIDSAFAELLIEPTTPKLVFVRDGARSGTVLLDPGRATKPSIVDWLDQRLKG